MLARTLMEGGVGEARGWGSDAMESVACASASGVPVDGEGEVAGAALGEGGAVAAARSRRRTSVAGVSQRRREGAVLALLRRGEERGSADGVDGRSTMVALLRPVFQLCKTATTLGPGRHAGGGAYLCRQAPIRDDADPIGSGIADVAAAR